MVSVNKSNAAPTVTEAKVSVADMFRHVIVMGKAARTAALELCYSSACYILLVSHFTDAKAKGYMTRGDAEKYLAKQIKEQAGVQGGMLDIYLRNANRLVGALTGSTKMFGPTLQQMGLVTEPEEMVKVLAGWCDKHMTDPAARRSIDSLSALSEALGYSTGRKTAPATLTSDPIKVQERVTNTVKAVEKLVMEGDKSGKKLHARVVTNAIANAIPAEQSLSLAREAIKRITDADDLKALETAIAEQRKTLAELATKAKANAKAKANDGGTKAEASAKSAKKPDKNKTEHATA